MRNRPFRIARLVTAAIALLAVPTVTRAQTTDDLIRQLCGKAEAPARNAQQLAEAYQKAIDALLPLMSADDVGSRYQHQIALQDMGSYAARPGAEMERESLAKVMAKTLEKAAMPDTVRHWFVLQLERIGKGEAVPVLTKLMSADDKHLRDYARRALEKNPDPSATDALLKELSRAKESTWRIGLINALGTRRDEAAVKPIVQALNDQDPKVSTTAVTALSQISGREIARALFAVLDKPAGPLSVKAAQGLIDMAQDMAAHNDTAGAAKIYGSLYDRATKSALIPGSPLPSSLRAAAVTGLIVCNPDRGAREIVILIQDDNPKIRAAAVQAASRAASKAPTQALGRMLPKLQPDSQVQVLGLIGDQHDASSINSVKDLLNSQDEAVSLAAIDAMTRIGTDVGTQALLQIAVNRAGAVQKAAQGGLVVMAGPQVDQIIKTQAAAGDVKARVVAIGLLGQRRISGAAKTLLGYATEANEDISAASFQALGDVADSVDLAALVDLLAKTRSSSAREKGTAALKAVLSKAKDKDAAAHVVIDRMTNSIAETKLTMLTSLSRLGGSTALKAVIDATQSKDEALRDAGIRTLSEWPDFEAAERLVGIASNPETSLTHYVLATRGAMRLITSSQAVPLDGRVALCLYALDHARRDEEKRQAIAAMGSLPSTKAADRLLELATDDKLKAEAGLAAVELAGALLMTDRQAARDLAQKIRSLNISAEVNRRADAVTAGRGRTGRKR